jgi:hypothetical protein
LPGLSNPIQSDYLATAAPPSASFDITTLSVSALPHPVHRNRRSFSGTSPRPASTMARRSAGGARSIRPLVNLLTGRQMIVAVTEVLCPDHPRFRAITGTPGKAQRNCSI